MKRCGPMRVLYADPHLVHLQDVRAALCSPGEYSMWDCMTPAELEWQLGLARHHVLVGDAGTLNSWFSLRADSRFDSAGVPVVLLGGGECPEAERAALERGAVAYLPTARLVHLPGLIRSATQQEPAASVIDNEPMMACREVNQYATVLAQEMNAVLLAIDGYAKLLERAARSGSVHDVQDYGPRIATNTMRLSQLISQLQAFGKAGLKAAEPASAP